MSSAKGEAMTDLSHFSTDDTPLRERSTHWNAVIADAYFPLMLHFRNPLDFSGQLSRMNLGQVGLSRLTSDPVNYERRRRHICESVEEEYLITLPMATAVEFRQLGRDVRCEPGGFLIERGDEPYRFMYEQPNDLFVLKVSKAHLCERIRQPEPLDQSADTFLVQHRRVVAEAQVFADGAGKQKRLLREVRHVAEPRRGGQLAPEWATAHQHAAAGRRVQPEQGADQRAFAGPRRPGDCRERTAFKCEVQPFDHGAVPGLVPER